jgi:NADH-quinone oxidoreductase subunit J
MTIQFILFFSLALIAIASALGMLFSRNAVYAALYLIINFGTVAVFYLLLDAPFIAISQVTVYAGAIMVLFLFVIMLLGAEQVGQSRSLPWQRPLATFLGVILLAEAIYLIFIQSRLTLPVSPVPASFGDPKSIGHVLFNQYLLPFEATSILLLAAIIGAIILTKTDKKKKESKE